jgi:hypothetical protein
MSWLERSTLAQALRAVAIYAVFLSYMRTMAADGRLLGEAGLNRLGLAILILIGATIAAGIIVQILAVILAAINGDEKMADLIDERDKAIERRAIEVGFGVVGFGFLAMALALWQGWGAIWAINLLLGGFVASDILVNLLKFRSYWRGA